MKKYFLLIIFVFMLCLPFDVLAANHIYNIDMNIYLNRNGSANITEKWDVKGEDGTEWYKVINGLEDVSDFTVKMDGRSLIRKGWEVDESLSQKKGYYGINYTSDGIELCFGKYDYSRHTFTLNYTIDKFIYNASDSQYLYWNLIGPLTNVKFENFHVKVSSYYNFPDTLDVWGYGYKGYAYVSNGVIEMSNEENTDMEDQYGVLLAKFPLETFSSYNTDSRYDAFDQILNAANEGSYKYDYNKKTNFWDIFTMIIGILFFPFLIIYIVIKSLNSVKNKYGYKNHEKIDLKEIHNFRDIPCNKDIYYANALLFLNNSLYKETNILGAILLKWVKEKKVVFRTQVTGLLKREESVIDLTLNPKFESDTETKLFNYMYKASKDGILENNEFKKWCQKNYNEFFKFFDGIRDDKIIDLKNDNEIVKNTNKKECKFQHLLSEKIYNDSVNLYGLYNYLEEFAGLKDKEVLEVNIWDEYLMFAYLFGNADKVAKQLKNLYPEVIKDLGYDMDTVIIINDFSSSSYSAASSARSAAESYSSGGGGFSSGGGGGGSFGGGGGGSR